MRRIAGFLLLLLALALGVGAYALWAIRRTLPPASEQVEASSEWPAGAGERIEIAYDAAGVPTVRAGNEIALAFGQGYAHARDRRFQMELFRRTASGRLSELVGKPALGSDRHFRALGFTAIADSAITRMEPRARAWHEAYAAGVRTFDAKHAAAPEFLVLGGASEPWRARDCVLVAQLMFEDLGYGAAFDERDRDLMDAALPASLVAFLTPWTTPFDAPLEGATGTRVSADPSSPRTPDPSEVNLRRRAALAPIPGRPSASALRPGAIASRVRLEDVDRGSNNWAIASFRSATGSAIAAGDPHLGLRVPVIWHRERLESPTVGVTGVTLPGLPGVVFGSNGAVAWSGTNLEGDFVDLVRCAVADAETLSYEGPAGRERFGIRREVLRVRGAAPETLLVRTTRHGPIVARGARGGLLAAQWTALDPTTHATGLYDLPGARSVRDLFDRLDDYRGPALNIVAADREGHIGWRVAGRVPRRGAFDPTRPRDARTTAGWTGYVGGDSLPEILDPASGFLWSANHRTLAPNRWRVLGHAPAMPWRARRLADVLPSRAAWTVEDCVRLQNDLDDAFLGITARALVRALPPDTVRADSTLAAVRHIVEGWERRADSTSVAHALLRFVRTEITDALIGPLVEPCVALDSTYVYDWNLADEVVRRLLEERPMHLLDPAYEDYDALVRAAARKGVRALRARGNGAPLESMSWGRVNRARIHHPLGDAIPALGRWLNMPGAALAGDSHVLRVARPRSGASMRMVADLSDPSRSRFALPGGQSGHFLSPHYGDHFADWVAGRTVPLEPGSPVATIVLTRARTPSR